MAYHQKVNEAKLVIEAYRALKDRGPHPAEQVIKDFEGSYAFVIDDSKLGTVFVDLGSDGGVKLFWGIAANGSVVISDDVEVIKAGCAKSFAPFPTERSTEGGCREANTSCRGCKYYHSACTWNLDIYRSANRERKERASKESVKIVNQEEREAGHAHAPDGLPKTREELKEEEKARMPSSPLLHC